MTKRPKSVSTDDNEKAKRTALPVRMALILGGLLVSLLFAEALLRWVFPFQFIYRHPRFVVLSKEPADAGPEVANGLLAPALALNDQAWRYSLRPNLQARLVSSEFDVAFETNDQGLRGPALGSRPGRRLLGLGDSFAMGFGVEREETYLSVWAGHHTQPAEPVHGGVIGYNPHNSAAFLFGHAATLRPDEVILQLWVGDDLCGPATAARPIIKAEASRATRLKFMLFRSHLAMLIRDRLRAIPPMRRWLMDRGLISRYAIDSLLSVDFSDRCAAPLAALSTRLAEIETFCRQRDIRFVLLLIPVREQVYEHDWERAIAYDAAAVDTAKIDFDAPNRAVRRIADEHGITLFDATDALRTARNGERLYFDGLDPHLTPRGHEVVGTALFRFLQDGDGH